MRSKYITLWRAEFDAFCALKGAVLPRHFKADGTWYPLDGGHGHGVSLSLDDPSKSPSGSIQKGILHQYVWRPRCKDQSGNINPRQVLAAHERCFPTRAYNVDSSDPHLIHGLGLPPGIQPLPAQIIGLTILSLQFHTIAPRELRLELQSPEGVFDVQLDMQSSIFMPPGCSCLQPGELVALKLNVLEGGTAELLQILDRSRVTEVRK